MEAKIQEKKSAVDLTDIALGIVVLGVIVSIGSTILIAQRDSRLTELSTVTTANETLTTVTASGKAVANTWVKGIATVTNATGGGVVPTTNYTFTIDSTFGTGTLYMKSGLYNATNVNVTYTWYNTSRSDWSLPNNAAIGLGEYGNWFKIIVIVGVAAVILSLIFVAFGGRAGQVNTQAY